MFIFIFNKYNIYKIHVIKSSTNFKISSDQIINNTNLFQHTLSTRKFWFIAIGTTHSMFQILFMKQSAFLHVFWDAPLFHIPLFHIPVFHIHIGFRYLD